MDWIYRVLGRATTFLLFLGCAAPACAQDFPRLSNNAAADTVRIYFMNDVAGNRIQPEFVPISIRVGNFDIRPQLQVNTNFDGNWLSRSDQIDLDTGVVAGLPALNSIYPTALSAAIEGEITALHINPQLARKWDVETDVDPQVAIISDWASNRLRFDASARAYRYARLVRENRVEYHSDLSGQIDFGDKQYISLAAGIDSRAETPGANGTAALMYYGFGPSMHTAETAQAIANLTFGRFLAQASAVFTRDYYSNVDLRTTDLLSPAGMAAANAPSRISVSQAYREDQTMQMTGNVTYSIAPETQIFAQTSYQFIQQLHPSLDTNGQPLHPFDSDTFSFLAGVAESIDRLIVFQVGAGWQYHRYGDSYYQNTSRLNLQGAIDWYPTPLLSLRLQTGQTYQGSAAYGVGDTSVRTALFRADYEILPNVEAWLLLASEWDKHPPGGGQIASAVSHTLIVQSGNVEVDYQANRNLGFGINFGMHRRLSPDPVVQGPFSAWRAGITVTFRH